MIQGAARNQEERMNVQGIGGIGSFAAVSAAASRSALWQQPAGSGSSAASAASGGREKVFLSDAAQAYLAQPTAAASNDGGVQQQLDSIKAKPALQRTAAETEFVQNHDARLNDIQSMVRSGGTDSLKADDLDYLQKAGGFVNTMSSLSADEKTLYDQLVASGNQDAAQGLRNVALARCGMGDQQVTLPDGQSFVPNQTALTGDNVRRLYGQMIVDPSGVSARAFSSLAAVLDARQAGA